MVAVASPHGLKSACYAHLLQLPLQASAFFCLAAAVEDLHCDVYKCMLIHVGQLHGYLHSYESITPYRVFAV